MSLPRIPLPSDEIEVDGQKISVRGLSRAEVIKLSEYGNDADGGENYVLSIGAGVSLDEAKEWRESSPADVVGVVIDKIIHLSGLDDLGKGQNKG